MNTHNNGGVSMRIQRREAIWTWDTPGSAANQRFSEQSAHSRQWIALQEQASAYVQGKDAGHRVRPRPVSQHIRRKVTDVSSNRNYLLPALCKTVRRAYMRNKGALALR